MLIILLAYLGGVLTIRQSMHPAGPTLRLRPRGPQLSPQHWRAVCGTSPRRSGRD